tara:strand:+ start:575 stop:1192 length:618 start_codon:yes stop_codon:yes gene_type:complete
MEDILDLYAESFDPERPVVCFDETSKQMVKHSRAPEPVAPRRPARYDYEYVRNGTSNLFMFFEALRGWRHVQVTPHRTAKDFAHQMKWLVDEPYRDATVVRVVLDNLNTHRIASLYKTFKPAEARRIARRLEFHHTPVHGSWLNMAELEFSVFVRECLKQRIPDRQTLSREVAALERERNAAEAKVSWRFTAHDARLKLARLYPS